MTEFPRTPWLADGRLRVSWALCVPGGVRSWCRWWLHECDPQHLPRHQIIQEVGSPGQVWLRDETGRAVKPQVAGWSVSEHAGETCSYSREGWRQVRVPSYLDWGEKDPVSGLWRMPGEELIYWAEQWLTYPYSFVDPLILPPDDFQPLQSAAWTQPVLS